MALGATRVGILRLLLSSGVRSIACGIAAGTPIAFGAAQTVAILLHNAPVSFQPKDPLTFFGVAWLLVFAGIAAMLPPASRAATADPMHALRDD